MRGFSASAPCAEERHVPRIFMQVEVLKGIAALGDCGFSNAGNTSAAAVALEFVKQALATMRIALRSQDCHHARVV